MSFLHLRLRRFALFRLRLTDRVERFARAWAYARCRLDRSQAQRILLDCYYPAGWHPLLVLTVEDTLADARSVFGDHPDLERLINDGCSRVGKKWESFNDELFEARSWAIELAGQYATAEGLVLEPIDAADSLMGDPEAAQRLNGDTA